MSSKFLPSQDKLLVSVKILQKNYKYNFYIHPKNDVYIKSVCQYQFLSAVNSCWQLIIAVKKNEKNFDLKNHISSSELLLADSNLDKKDR